MSWDRFKGRGSKSFTMQFVSSSDKRSSSSTASTPSSSSNTYYRGAEIPPPSSLTNASMAVMRNTESATLSKQGYETLASIASQSYDHRHDASSKGAFNARKRARTEEDYFNEDEEEVGRQGGEEEDLPYMPAPGSPSTLGTTKEKKEESEEEDTLDAFMANLEEDAKKQASSTANKSSREMKSGGGKSSEKGIRDDIEEADDEESYYKWLQENPQAGKVDEDEDENAVEYDEDGNPIVVHGRKYIDPLPSIDHDNIQYGDFEKNFYVEHDDISTLSPIQVIDLQHKLGISASGMQPHPKPVCSFAHFGFPEKLLKAVRKAEFTQPTPIQAMGIPTLMSGRDAVCIAKTGSGKTAAFLWPMLVHINDQPELRRGDGPIGLILVPTRELALQIYAEAKKFAKVFNMEVVCAYGGGSKYEQSKAFEAGAEIAVATPGRMIDMIKLKVTNLERVTMLVLDEADRMFNMGFEPQVRSICDHVRPDRQCCLYSATFKKRIERLARDVLNDPIKIIQGHVGEASTDVTQMVKVMDEGGYKWQWLTSNLVSFTSEGSVLIFVTKKQNCEELNHNLQIQHFQCKCIHGDLFQHERNEIISEFKKQSFPILVATDVAARGLDIGHIRTVINFDLARDIDTHTHRIGRTGRAGNKGSAYTLITEKDKEMAGHLVRNLENANQHVGDDLMKLAMSSSWFRSARNKAMGTGRSGLGSRDRPGLGSGSSTSNSRLAAMKAAIAKGYAPKFQKAESEDNSSTKEGHGHRKQTYMAGFVRASDDDNSSKDAGQGRKRRSRWE